MNKKTLLSKKLKQLNEKSSWRDIADEYPGVNFATLNRIANSNGKWIPKNKHIQELLGLFPQKRVFIKRYPAYISEGRL